MKSKRRGKRRRVLIRPGCQAIRQADDVPDLLDELRAGEMLNDSKR